MKILLFGTGDYYERYKKWFAEEEIIALLDNSLKKQNTSIDGIKVVSPEEGVQLEYDIIIILSFYVKEMKRQLISLGVREESIYHFFQLHKLLKGRVQYRPVKYYEGAEKIVWKKGNNEKKILLLSQELTLGGPPIALYHAAMILKKQGYRVVYASMLDGPLREKLQEQKIPVVVDENLQLAKMKEVDWVNTFSLIVCNTLSFHIFLSERDTEIPVVWWLHDARFFYDGVDLEIMQKINLDNLKVVSVGKIPYEAIREFIPTLPYEELLYGVADVENRNVTEAEDKQGTRFITIGFLENIKGQDILLKAIEQLRDDIKGNARFFIVGYHKTLFGEKLKYQSKDIEEIIFTGNVGRDEIHHLLRKSDVLICPSRQDSMPTVAAEAMMHAVPCILSDVVGTAAYICDERDGLIFSSENVQELVDKISWCMYHKEELVALGGQARKIYEKLFSMDAFEKQLLKVVKELI